LPPKPKDATIGFTGFIPRHIREPVAKQGGKPPNVPKPPDPRPGYTGKREIPDPPPKD